MFGRKKAKAEPVGVAARPAGPAMHQGVVIEPEEGDKLRVSSAADIDPNVKARGLDGIPRGDAGGYGGAGTSSG